MVLSRLEQQSRSDSYMLIQQQQNSLYRREGSGTEKGTKALARTHREKDVRLGTVKSRPPRATKLLMQPCCDACLGQIRIVKKKSQALIISMKKPANKNQRKIYFFETRTDKKKES